MKIENSNGNIINTEIYIHDDIFNNLLYDKNSNTLRLLLSKSNECEDKHEINYINVIAF